MTWTRSPSIPYEQIAANLAEVERRVADACERAGRDRDDVTLIAVSKTFGPDAITSAIEAGVTDLGENRVQELREKFPSLSREARWHMIGHLQSNKARDAARLFGVIHSVDRESLADKLAHAARELDRRIEVLVQVNIGEEPQKSGVAIDRLDSLVRHVAGLEPLTLVGLMTIPPIADDEVTRRYFRRMRELRDDLRDRMRLDGLTELSMGMTDDFETAIEEGATMIRVGRAIFGERS
jgi:pyridoxal phosphate enzyme (YggS family)